MLTDHDALIALAATADEPEASRSAYWKYEIGNFSVDVDGSMIGRTTLGNASRRVSMLRNGAHYLLQRPLCGLASAFEDFSACERLGRLIARRQNRQFTNDMLRQCFTLALIRHYLDIRGSDECNMVIGDGYGVMSTLLLMHAPRRRTIVVNLTKPLLLDLAHVRQAFPGARLALVSDRNDMRAALADDRVSLIAVRADDAAALVEASIGLAVNVLSMP